MAQPPPTVKRKRGRPRKINIRPVLVPGHVTDDVSTVGPDNPPPPRTVNRRGRQLILETAPGGKIPPSVSAISPATLVDGKPVGRLIGFRVTEESREIIVEQVEKDQVTMRTWLVRAGNADLAHRPIPPLPDPMYEHRRAKALVHYDTAAAPPRETQASVPSPPVALSPVTDIDALSVDEWMQMEPPSGLEAFAIDIQKLVTRGYAWAQIAMFLQQARGVEVTERGVAEWWSRRPKPQS